MVNQISVADLKNHFDAGDIASGQLVLLDVREINEYAQGHVPGAINIPMALLPLRVSELNRSKNIAVICESGGRSAQSTQWLENNGYTAMTVTGGTSYWRSSGFPVEK